MNIKKLLTPFNLSRTLVFVVGLPLTIYLFTHAEDMYDSKHYLSTIQQSLLPILFLINGIEELKKQDGKKNTLYMNFGGAFLMIVLTIATYFHWKQFHPS